MSTSITVNELTKVYPTKSFGKGKIKALDNVSFDIEEKTIFGLLGPNGAGKTTLVKILLGSVHPTIGTATILGKSLKDYEIRTKVGYLPENHKFPNYLTGEEVIKYYSQLNGYDLKKEPAKIDADDGSHDEVGSGEEMQQAEQQARNQNATDWTQPLGQADLKKSPK